MTPRILAVRVEATFKAGCGKAWAEDVAITRHSALHYAMQIHRSNTEQRAAARATCVRSNKRVCRAPRGCEEFPSYG